MKAVAEAAIAPGCLVAGSLELGGSNWRHSLTFIKDAFLFNFKFENQLKD